MVVAVVVGFCLDVFDVGPDDYEGCDLLFDGYPAAVDEDDPCEGCVPVLPPTPILPIDRARDCY